MSSGVKASSKQLKILLEVFISTQKGVSMTRTISNGNEASVGPIAGSDAQTIRFTKPSILLHQMGSLRSHQAKRI